MLDSAPELTRDRGVREGRLTAVTCLACGCRLAADQHDEAWYHFAGTVGHDARGCRTACVEVAHDRFGRVASVG